MAKNQIKSAIIQKNIEGTLYDIMVRTNAENVDVGEGKSLKAKITEMSQSIAAVITSDTVDSKIRTATTDLYNRIMGITEQDGTAVNEAFDTLKEVAAWLANDSNKTAADIVTDIKAVSDKVGEWNTATNGTVAAKVASLATSVEANTTQVAANTEAIAKKGNVTYSTLDGDVSVMTENDVHLKEATALDA